MAAKNSIPLTAERLRELFHYAPETGVFTRLLRTSNSVRIGDVAGCRNVYGYWQINCCGKIRPAHRLAWLYVHGVWPKEQVDHIDGDRANNRIDNLREATSAENKQNTRRPRSDNRSSGLLGVSKEGIKWHAKIQVKNRTIHLGYFESANEAHAEYLRAKAIYHPFNTLNRPDGEMRKPRTYTSKFVGVSWNTGCSKWIATIMIAGKNRHLGVFDTQELAHEAYLLAKSLAHAGTPLVTGSPPVVAAPLVG